MGIERKRGTDVWRRRKHGRMMVGNRCDGGGRTESDGRSSSVPRREGEAKEVVERNTRQRAWPTLCTEVCSRTQGCGC